MKTNHFILVLFIMALINFSCPGRSQYEIIDLGTGSYNTSYAKTINERGQIIGKLANIEGHYERAESTFFWDNTNGIVNLSVIDGKESHVYTFNDMGQGAGWIKDVDDNMHPLLWSNITGVINLGELSEKIGWAAEINNSGQLVGGINIDANDSRVFLWDSKKGLVYLCDVSSSAVAINDKNQIVGFSKDAHGNDQLVFWNNNGKMINLGSPGGLIENVLLNNSGQVAIGWARIAKGEFHAFFWDSNGKMTDLGTLGGKVSYASAINDNGQVVGWSQAKFSPGRRAFIWDSVKGMKNLGTLSIFDDGPFLDNNSMAFAINNHGQVVGFCGSEFPEYFGPGCAWLWDKKNGMMKLESLIVNKSGWKRLISANDISDRGQIVGFGETKNGETHAFLMSPVSENKDK